MKTIIVGLILFLGVVKYFDTPVSAQIKNKIIIAPPLPPPDYYPPAVTNHDYYMEPYYGYDHSNWYNQTRETVRKYQKQERKENGLKKHEYKKYEKKEIKP